MISPPKPNQPQTNPRDVLHEEGARGLAERLTGARYRIKEDLLSDYVQVLRSGKIWMIEGEPGAGKSAVALATQAAFNMTMFPVQGMSELTLGDLLYEWNREAQNQSVIQSVSSGVKTLEEAQREQYTMRFLKLGRALGAFHFAGTTGQVPLFFFDEVDKLPEYLQDMLLGLLECGYSYVPDFNQPIGIYDSETGYANRALFPLCIFTSNNLRFKLSPPFRSRCFYSWLERPTPEEEVAILHARVPEASPSQVRCIAKINGTINAIPGVQNKPGLRELIDLLQAFVRDEVQLISEETLARYIGYLAKQQSQIKSLRLALARVVGEIYQRDDQLDLWIAQAFGRERLMLEAA
ncbi:MAG: AAA family ATPase [Pyrinomonadaceae bacterium MAG19_C2-C3]|nr:AAA family ATPase [Pyrinomonadaceae bacterium MAG19_C2-C3]